MEWVFLWLLCGFIAAAIGSGKGEGCAAFIMGVLLGPFGIVFAVMSKGNKRNCPFCKQLINKEASVCPQCSRDLPEGWQKR